MIVLHHHEVETNADVPDNTRLWNSCALREHRYKNDGRLHAPNGVFVPREHRIQRERVLPRVRESDTKRV